MEEQELIRLCQSGDRRAFEQLFRAQVHTAVRTAYLITRDWALAEDAAQEAFVRAFRSIGSFRLGQPFGPWLYRIVVNEARRLAGRTGKTTAMPADEELLPAGAPGPEDALLAQERRSLLYRAIENLKEDHRLVVILKYFNGFSEAEIAAVLRIPLSTVKSRLYVARQRLIQWREASL